MTASMCGSWHPDEQKYIPCDRFRASKLSVGSRESMAMPYMRPPARCTPTQGRVLPRNGAAVMSPLPVPACIGISSPLHHYYAASCRDAGGSGFGVRYCEAGGGGVLMSSRVHVRRVSTIRTRVRFICARQLLSLCLLRHGKGI